MYTNPECKRPVWELAVDVDLTSAQEVELTNIYGN